MESTMRVQLDIPDNKFNELKALIEECGFATNKEFFDNAITLFKWVVKQARKGNVIASVDESERRYTELQMPFLERVSPQHIAAGHADDAAA